LRNTEGAVIGAASAEPDSHGRLAVRKTAAIFECLFMMKPLCELPTPEIGGALEKVERSQMGFVPQ
jgi:hypothetical protein